MKKLVPLFVVGALVASAPAAQGQTLIEVGGETSYTTVKVSDWLGAGVFDPQRVGYGVGARVLFGQREDRGFHYGLDIGRARLMNYRFVFQGEIYESGINTTWAQAMVRFWFENGAWFGEGSAGVVNLDGSKGSGTVWDPILGLGVGKPVSLSDQLSLVGRAGGSLIFDSESMVLSVRASLGLSYALGN